MDLSEDLFCYIDAKQEMIKILGELGDNKIWNQILSDYKINCFVADFDGHLIASCTLVVVPNLTRGARPYGLIENVITHADYRPQGVGRRLIHHALQFAWSHNCYKVMLLSGNKREEIHQFYEKSGFKKGIKTGFVATFNT
ncbi:hypothetical protein NIES2101_30950 [Calothrix sp. HK-06]|nr:hypothetical protein NIES2101_30950 [Calothrix sp. HK-06]